MLDKRNDYFLELDVLQLDSDVVMEFVRLLVLADVANHNSWFWMNSASLSQESREKAQIWNGVRRLQEEMDFITKDIILWEKHSREDIILLVNQAKLFRDEYHDLIMYRTLMRKAYDICILAKEHSIIIEIPYETNELIY